MKFIAIKRISVLNTEMDTKQRRWLLLSLLLTLVGMGLHFYLSQKFFALKFGTSEGTSFCNINSYLNCDAVSASSYSSLFGYPLALWGLATNFIFLIIQTAVLFQWFTSPRDGQILSFLSALFISIVSIAMALISTTQLKQVCIFCAGTYFISWVSFALISSSFRPKFHEIKIYLLSLFSTNAKTWIFIFAIPAVTWFLNSTLSESALGGRNLHPSFVNEKIIAWQAAPLQNFDMNTGLKLGPDSAIMKIVEFADFRCPHCRTAYPSLHAFTEAHPEVQLIFKPFPLDGTCNPDPAFEGKGDGISCRLALAALCSQKATGQDWLLHHQIFDEQEQYRMLSKVDDVDAKICGIKGVDCEQLKQCMNSEETLRSLKTMSQEAIQAKIRGTPTVFVNGKLLEGAQMLQILQAARMQLDK